MHDDEKAIVDLTIAYTWALDDRRFDDLRSIFAADATADLAGVHCDGIEAIIARIRGALTKVYVSQHVISNQQVRVDGDSHVSLLPGRQHTRRAAGRRALHHERHVLGPSRSNRRWLAHHRTVARDPLDRGQPRGRRPLTELSTGERQHQHAASPGLAPTARVSRWSIAPGQRGIAVRGTGSAAPTRAARFWASRGRRKSRHPHRTSRVQLRRC